VYVGSTRCEHGDLSPCFEEIACNNDTNEVGCEHDVCTCVDKPEGEVVMVTHIGVVLKNFRKLY